MQHVAFCCDADRPRQWLALVQSIGETCRLPVEVDSLACESGGSVLDHVHQLDIPEVILLQATAGYLNSQFFENLSAFQPSKAFLDFTPISFARQHLVLGLRNEDGE